MASAVISGQAPTEVAAERADESGPVLWCADKPVGFICAGVSLHGVQCQVQPACDLEQTDAVIEQTGRDRTTGARPFPISPASPRPQDYLPHRNAARAPCRNPRVFQTFRRAVRGPVI
ncbi:hypothetical protein GCM10022222_52100 [Amycolatopsis ultiminotia]|uniref:Uncharacterized protein n=1 Tax=Amycolatopsis ultiminotia TaxID=543629 RepID=A0ABP6X7Y3_9PSEU